MQEFLLDTSILDRLSGPLCDAVTGWPESQALIEQLEQRNLFLIPLDDDRRWYRYHHLFADVLRQRLQQARQSAWSELHRRASEWFEQSGSSPEAIEYALRGRDWPRAVALIEATMAEVQGRGELATLLRWLGALPDEATKARPTLGLAHAWLLVIVDDFATAERRLAVAEQAVRALPASDPAAQNALLGQMAVVRATSALMLEAPGEVTVAAGHEALALLPVDDLGQRGLAVFIIGCANYLSLAFLHLSQMRAIVGQLGAAAAACEALTQLAGQPGWEHFPADSLGRVMLGRVLYERNELAAALETLTVALAEVERYSLKRPELIGVVHLARVKLALGATDEARALLNRAWTMIQKHQLKQLTFPAAALRARMLIQMGDLAAAAQWSGTIVPPPDGLLNPAWEADYIALSRVWLALGRSAEAQSLLGRLLPPAEAAGRMARAIEILALQSVAARTRQDAGEAMATLERALGLAEPEGFVRTFLDEGQPMQSLLGQVTGEGQAYAQRLLAAFDLAGAPAPASVAGRLPPTGPGLQLIERLRERELEVLRLIALGYNNREIADRLVVGLSTVKTHVNHLFQKLGVASRTQALARARELGLLGN